MSASVLDSTRLTSGFTSAHSIDYGCKGRGNYDAFSKPHGRPVDDVDRFFYKWKKCIQCATSNDPNQILSYDYRLAADSCGKYKWSEGYFLKYVQLIRHMKVELYANAIEFWSAFWHFHYQPLPIMMWPVVSKVNRSKFRPNVVTGTHTGLTFTIRCDLVAVLRVLVTLATVNKLHVNILLSYCVFSLSVLF